MTNLFIILSRKEVDLCIRINRNIYLQKNIDDQNELDVDLKINARD